MKKFEQFKVSRNEMKKVWGGFRPKHISESWCRSYWSSQTQDGAGYDACINTCNCAGECECPD